MATSGGLAVDVVAVGADVIARHLNDAAEEVRQAQRIAVELEQRNAVAVRLAANAIPAYSGRGANVLHQIIDVLEGRGL